MKTAIAHKKKPPPELLEIQSTLLNEQSGLAGKIVRSLGDFTVALLAISGHPERQELAGTGTLLTIGKAHFILTARHVWEERLTPADYVGLTTKPFVKHRFAISRKDFVVFALPKPDAWNEWGPDLVLLRIPAEYIGRIEVNKVFLNVARKIRMRRILALQMHILMGTPAAHSKITGSHADLQIDGIFLGGEKQRKRGSFDYLEYKINLRVPGPRKFGGVSGGGVWRVYLYRSRETGKIDWVSSLHGVAFYQLAIANEYRPIRCHGPRSIMRLIRQIKKTRL